MRIFFILICAILFTISNGNIGVFAQEQRTNKERESKVITENSSFKEGIKGWRIEKSGPGEFIIKVEKRDDNNILHVIRKGSHKNKGYVSIYQEWEPPAQGYATIIQIEARINKHQLKTTGIWSKKDPKTACYPIHLFLYTPNKCIYDWGIISRDLPSGYPINYIRRNVGIWFSFESVPIYIKETGLKKVEIRCEGYDFDVEFKSIKAIIIK